MKKKIIGTLSILLFLLLQGYSGTSYAVVLDNNIIKEYANIVYNKTNGTMQKTILDLLNSTEFANENINFENMNNIRIYVNRGNDTNLNYQRNIGILDFSSNPQIEITSNQYFQYKGAYSYTNYNWTISYHQQEITQIVYNGTNTGTTNANINVWSNGADNLSYILIDNVINNNNYTYYGWNQYYGITTRGQSANVTEDNEPRPIADAYIGNVYTNIDYNVYYVSNGIKTYYNGQVTTYTDTVTNGHTTIIAVNKNGIVNGATYYIEIVQGQTILATSSGIILTTNSGSSGSGSGGSSGGNVDLTDTNNKIDSVKEEVTTQGNAIINALESGEQKAEERDNFWKETYENLFTLDSGDVEEMLEDFTERVDFQAYGDVGIEESILGVLEGEPDDFKITWQDIKTPTMASIGIAETTLIPAGEINFSKMTRENEALGRVKNIVNLLCSFTLIMLLIKNIWFTLMRVLGVGVDMYESQEEENERLAMVNTETINVNGDNGTYTVTKTNYNPRTRQRTNITWKGE